MPSVTYDGQSFIIDGRRSWIVGAALQYARIPAELWGARLAAVKQAGFNAIEIACPWMLHEPRPGRFNFEGQANLSRFIQLAGQSGLRVMVRVGPYVGEQFTGGGLPSWLLDIPDLALRQANEPFRERVSLYFRRLLAELVELQVTKGGPVLLVQSEHAWACSNPKQAEDYLREMTRIIRENGINVPLTNANDLWQESVGTIDTWRGSTELLLQLRQLRTVQRDAPRLVSTFEVARPAIWGEKATDLDADRDHSVHVLNQFAQILAAGAQAVVSPFHAGTNLGFLGGRLAGQPDAFVTTTAAPGSPLGEAGERTPLYHAIRQLASFANSFGHVFAELDPEYHPIVLDPDPENESSGSKRVKGRKSGDACSIVPLRGMQGEVVFVFGAGDRAGEDATLLLSGGVRMPVRVGRLGVGWYVFNVDLHGSGQLDYCNLRPLALVDRQILVLVGPEKSQAFLSIDGSPLSAQVPSGSKPVVVEHRGLTVVICNEDQADVTYSNDTTVFVGTSGLDGRHDPLPAEGYAKLFVIGKGGAVEMRPPVGGAASGKAKRGSSLALSPWMAAGCSPYCKGDSPRFATLNGPETLTACGAPEGYGWYRVGLKLSGSKKRLVYLPQSGDRLHLYLNGKLLRIFGQGPGADHRPFEIKASSAGGPQWLVTLADNLGRSSEGNDIGERKGLFGHVQEIKAISARPKVVTAAAVDPFTMRGFIIGRAAGQLSDTKQVAWTINHTRKTIVVIDVDRTACRGTFVLNDKPLHYFAGTSGTTIARIMLDPAKNKSFRKGKNVLRFAPDPRQEGALAEISKTVRIYECISALSSSEDVKASAATGHVGKWAFAKWEPPITTEFAPVARGSAAAKALRGHPCWWRSSFATPALAEASASRSIWLDLTGMSKGQVFLNGINLGRYFTTTERGAAVGPQQRLYLPECWMRTGSGAMNDVLIFDEHGCEPAKVRIVAG